MTRAERLEIGARTALFLLIASLGVMFFPAMLRGFGPLVGSTMGVFAAAVLANATVVRLFEEGRLTAAGLAWTPISAIEIFLGFVLGAAGVTLITVAALVFGMASFASIPGESLRFGGLLYVSVVLIFGAFGEELLFRGHLFRYLMAQYGDFAMILPFAVLFGLVHMSNANASVLGILNTIAWGVLLGYSYLRSRTLWLPFGLHYGWNLAQFLFGINISGFTIGVTGYQLRWDTSDFWSGGAYGLEGSPFTTVIVVALFYMVHRLMPKVEYGAE
jgi:membrane protease YdiL (CAAX protease family)